MLQFVQSFVSKFSKYIEIKTYGMIILPVVLYECETWSLTLKTVQRLRMCEKMFGPKWGGLNCIVRGVMIYISRQIVL